MQFWIDIEDGSGTAYGDGAVIDALSFEYTRRMSRAGSFSFSMPAESDRAALVAEKRVARCYAVVNNAVTEIGSGIIDRVEYAANQDGQVMLTASGDDLMRELTYRQVGTLTIDDGAGGATTNAVSIIIAKAPSGWTASGTSAVSLLHEFEGETVLAALVRLSEITGENFRLGAGRQVVWVTSDTSSGITLLYGVGVTDANNAATVIDMQIEYDSYDQISRVYPVGVGTGSAQLTLDGATWTPPAGYTINTVDNYIVTNPEPVRIEEYTSFKDIQQPDTLAQAAFTYLSQRVDAGIFYRANIITNAVLYPAQTARLVARKIIDGVEAVNVDETLTIIETTTRIDADGLRTVAAQLSSVKRYPDGDAQSIVSSGAVSRDSYTYPQPGQAANITAGTVNRAAKYTATDTIGQSQIADARTALLTLSGAAATEVNFDVSDNEYLLAYNSTLAKWRARAQDNLTLVGDVLYLQASTAAGTDLALGVTPTAISAPIINPTYATDGNDSTYANITSSTGWENKGYSFDLGAEYWVHSFRCYSTDGAGGTIGTYYFQYYNGSVWVDALEITPIAVDETRVLTTPIEARYWRFRGKVGGAGHSENWRAYTLSIYELAYSSFTRERLGIGSSGQVLTVSAGLPSWQTPAVNPIGTSGTAGRLLKYTSSSAAENSQIAESVTGGVLTLAGTLTTNRTLTAPDAAGTLALLERAQTFTAAQRFDGGIGVSTAALPAIALLRVAQTTASVPYSLVSSIVPTATSGTFAATLSSIEPTPTANTSAAYIGNYYVARVKNNYNLSSYVAGTAGQVVNDGEGTAAQLYGVMAQAGISNLSANGNVTLASAFRLQGFFNLSTGAGAIATAVIFDGDAGMASINRVTNAYGLRLGNISAGTSSNYAIYTGTGLNRFGDAINVIGSSDSVQAIIRTHSTQTANGLEYQNSAGNVLNSFTPSGGARFGTYHAGNYTQFAADGTLTLFGDARVDDDLRVAMSATAKGGSKDPDFGKVKDDGSGSQGVFTYLFDAGTEEELYFAVQLPHSWEDGTSIEPHIHWMPTTTGSGNVVWGLEYTWANMDAAFGNTAIISVTDAADGTAYKHQYASFGTVTATGKTYSSMLLCRIFRDATSGSDTYAADAAILEIDFHYTINKLGS